MIQHTCSLMYHFIINSLVINLIFVLFLTTTLTLSGSSIELASGYPAFSRDYCVTDSFSWSEVVFMGE